MSRARLVLDYSITLLLYHLLMVTLYSDHVPSTFLWWALNGTTCGIMVFGGEYVCMQLEMEPIILGGSGASQSNNNNSVSSSGNNANSNNNNSSGGGSSSGSGALASQGASLSGMHDGYGAGNYEESAGLLMETLDHNNNGDLSNHMSLSGSTRTMPTKARSSEDTGGFRGGSGFSPAIRSSILGNQSHGRQRTSDRYESVPTADADNR